MRRHAGTAVVLAGAALTAAAPDALFGRIAYLVTFAVITVAAWRGVWRRPARGGRLPWAMVAAAVSSWLAGDLTWNGLSLLVGEPPSVGLPDVFWLAGYPLMGTAIVLMVRHRAPGQARAGLQDGATLTTAAALGAWQFLIEPGLADAGSPLDVVVGALYPFGDVLLLGSVLFLVLSPGRRGWPVRLLLGGTVLTLALDVAMTVLPRYWSSGDVDRLNGGLLLANALVVAAVSHRDRDELVTPVRAGVASLHPARVLCLGLALVTAPLMAVLRGSLADRERLLLLAGTAATVALTLARFTGAVREQGRAQRLLAHRADHDELTGLANRRVLTEHLANDFRPLADTVLLYLDLDGFKAVNDRYGHATGDAVLIEVARRLVGGVRPGDVAARLGGDEFAVLCLGLGPAAAQQLADGLRRAVSAPIEAGGRSVRVGASVGIACAADCASGEELISRADHAMFVAKRWTRTAQAA